MGALGIQRNPRQWMQDRNLKEVNCFQNAYTTRLEWTAIFAVRTFYSFVLMLLVNVTPSIELIICILVQQCMKKLSLTCLYAK